MGKYYWDLAAFRHNGNTYLTEICAHSVTLIKKKIFKGELLKRNQIIINFLSDFFEDTRAKFATVWLQYFFNLRSKSVINAWVRYSGCRALIKF